MTAARWNTVPATHQHTKCSKSTGENTAHLTPIQRLKFSNQKWSDTAIQRLKCSKKTGENTSHLTLIQGLKCSKKKGEKQVGKLYQQLQRLMPSWMAPGPLAAVAEVVAQVVAVVVVELEAAEVVKWGRAYPSLLTTVVGFEVEAVGSSWKWLAAVTFSHKLQVFFLCTPTCCGGTVRLSCEPSYWVLI